MDRLLWNKRRQGRQERKLQVRLETWTGQRKIRIQRKHRIRFKRAQFQSRNGLESIVLKNSRNERNMLDRMGGGLPVMAALLFCKEIKKRAANKLLLLFFFQFKSILILLLLLKIRNFD